MSSERVAPAVLRWSSARERLGRAWLVARSGWGEGLPDAGGRELFVARAVLLAVSAWLLLVGLWEIGAPFGAGPDGISSATTLGGENMLRHHVIAPVIEHSVGRPTALDCYCRHPFGSAWTAAAFVGIFGHHDWVCRLPPALLGALLPALLYGIGRGLWSPFAGALAALAFAFTPIALAFANVNGPELPASFGSLLATWALLRSCQSPRRRYLVLSLLGLGYAVHSSWAAYGFAAVLLALVFVRTFLRGRRLAEPDFRRAASWFAWAALVVVASALFYVLLLLHYGRLDDLLAELSSPRLAPERPLAALAERRYWVALSFTPFAVRIGELATLGLALRLIVRRNELEGLPLAVLAMALLQYAAWRREADASVYWLYSFAPYFALVLGAFAESIAQIGTRIAALRRRRPEFTRGVLYGAVAVGVPLSMAPDALRTLDYARATGGAFREPKRIVQADRDKSAALAFVGARAPAGEAVLLDRSMKQAPWMHWVVGRPLRTAGVLDVKKNENQYVVDARFARSDALREILGHHRTSVVGPFFIAELKRRPAPITGYALERREPSLLERFLVSSHALYDVVPDPFVTWELRDGFVQRPNPPPAVEPVGFEQLRIAHNIALAQGDRDRASTLRARLLEGLDRGPAVEYADRTLLLGVRLEHESSPVLSVYFEARGAEEQRFAIRSRVESNPGSLVPADPEERDVGMPSIVPRDTWKAGFLYSSVTEIAKRPGRERFLGSWLATGPDLSVVTRSGAKEVTLLVLP